MKDSSSTDTRLRCFPRILWSALFGLALCFSASAQALTIELSWDSDDFDGFEGGLVLPRKDGEEPLILRSSRQSSSADKSVRVQPSLVGGKAVWTADKLVPGIYSFYVSDLAGLDGLDEPSSFDRASLRVTVTSNGRSVVYDGPERVGAIWHVCDIQGEDGQQSAAGAVLPGKSTVYGYVRDAATGEPIADADVTLVSKVDKTTLKAKTSAAGKYLIGADFGAWSLTLSKPGYIGWSETVAFIKTEYPARVDAHLSSLLRESQYRFVLSWGAKPQDLDAHMTGPGPSGDAFHLSYRIMRSYGGRHSLDQDSQQGFGPETVTLDRLDSGTYVFSVHDYSDRQLRSSSRLASSGATVRVYRESELIGEAKVREDSQGTLWRVFALDGRNGALAKLDEYAYEPEPARVR